ncbi:MAG: hypothetical protein FWG03_11395 [Clostridiales bacterium]|nr:hypothetical protein [Clostridiales bacterium]
MFKATKLFAALAIALVLCLGCVAPAFAALDENGALKGTEANPAQAAITKILQMPKGTATPTASFVFEVEAISVDGDETAGAVATMPTIGDITLGFTAAKTGSTDNGVKRVVAESPDIFADISKPFPHAGVYKYEITEKEKTNTAIDANKDHEDLTYSPAKYTLMVYVNNKTAPATGTYIYAIGTYITVIDNDEQEEGDKIDPTPLKPDVSGDYSKMIFTNTYVKTNGPTDPEKPDPTKDSTLNVSKTVTGSFGNKELYFDFSLTVTAPSLVYDPTDLTATAPVYKAYVVDADGTIVSTDDLLDYNKVTAADEDDNDNAYIEFISGAAKTFSLKHGQKLVFIDTPVGTSYDVEETKAAGYIPNVSVIYNGKTPVVTNNNKDDIDFGVTGELVGEATTNGKLANSADFINERKDVSLTGLSFSDLPFIGMIILAVGAIAAYIVAKSRKAKRSHN